jgi:hypothetical protein
LRSFLVGIQLLQYLELTVTKHILHIILVALMVGKDLAAAVNAVNKTTRSNDVPGNEDTEDNDTERNSSYISTNLINHPPANEVTEDMRKIEEAGRRRKEKFLAARRDAKAKFEAKRKIVLDRVPEDYKKMFGQLGFIGWGQAVLPAIIMSPYDVPMGEGSPREKWLIMFSKVSALVLVRNRLA